MAKTFIVPTVVSAFAQQQVLKGQQKNVPILQKDFPKGKIMTETRTDAIRAFQKRVHDMNSANQRDLRLTAQEARNISNELSQLTALLLQLQSNNNAQENIEITVSGLNF